MIRSSFLYARYAVAREHTGEVVLAGDGGFLAG
jgi:hypothetical protein